MSILTYNCTFCGNKYESKEIVRIPRMTSKQKDMLLCMTLPLPAFSVLKLGRCVCKHCVSQYADLINKINAAFANCDNIVLVNDEESSEISYVVGSEISIKTPWKIFPDNAKLLLKALAKFYDRDMVLRVKIESDPKGGDDFVYGNTRHPNDLIKMYTDPDDNIVNNRTNLVKRRTVYCYSGIAVKIDK